MPKKPVVATAQELEEAEERLTELIKKTAADAAQQAQGVDRKLLAAVQDLQKKLDANAATAAEETTSEAATAKAYTEECISALNSQLVAFFPPIEARAEEIYLELLSKVEETDGRLQQLMVDELSALGGQMDDELTNLKNELTNNLQEWGREAAEALVEQRRQLDDSIEALRQESIEDRRCIRAEVKHQFEETCASQLRKDNEQDAIREEERREIYVQFDEVDSLIRAKEEKAHNHTEDVANTAENNRAALSENNHQRIVRLSGECEQLRSGLREVENVSTRRIEWVIKDASKVFKPPVGGWSPEANDRSWYSPKFNGAGAWGLQFEVKLFGPPPKNQDGGPEQSGGTGNMGIYLWACKGTKMAFKLYIGERAMPLEKKFTGRSPAGTGRLCWVKDQINKEDDTLRVGVEFLEAMREVEYPSRLPPPPLALTGRAPEEIGGIMKDIEYIEGAEDAGTANNEIDGSLCFMRHLNNRVLDQVQSQVSGMESRMVRKVQWLVQYASKLRQRFPWGHAICSPTFAAAGVENIQFAFYPSGYGAVTDGYCSVFLYCPAGCTMHFYISIAKQVREITHEWETAGAFGKTNFCLYDTVIDLVDDSILLTLEIEDAQQEASTPFTHQADATGDADKDNFSVTKLTKNPGKTPNGRPNGRGNKLDTAMQLPSLWAPKAWVEGDQAKSDIPEGYHSFEEVLKRRPAPTGGTRPESPKSPKSPKTPHKWEANALVANKEVNAMQNSSSAPALRLPGARPAMQEDLSPPLPPISAGSVTLGHQSTGNWNTADFLAQKNMADPGGASSLGKARKAAGRRPRPDSAGLRRGSPPVDLAGHTTR